jgi:hypothetical protein
MTILGTFLFVEVFTCGNFQITNDESQIDTLSIQSNKIMYALFLLLFPNSITKCIALRLSFVESEATNQFS